MKKALIFIIFFLIGFFISSCGNQKQKNSERETQNDSLFVHNTSPQVYAQIDTLFTYYNSHSSNFIITKLIYNHKLITVMYAEGSASDFKILSIDSTSKENPIFLK